MLFLKSFSLFLFFIVLGASSNACSAELYAAVASNFTEPMTKLSSSFTKATGIAIKPVFASTGKLYAMIKNGGPFDIFFAADSARPDKLYQEGVADKPFIYAIGSTVLWSNIEELCTSTHWQDVLNNSSVQIVLANPQLAPYGTSAMKVLQTANITGVKQRLVYSQNVAQAMALASKVTGLGFTATSMSLTKNGRQGCTWEVPQADKIIQSACVVRTSAQKEYAETLVTYLESPAAKTILNKYGFSD